MRWSWRADLLPVVLDALLEGSLVGVVYVAVAPEGPSSSAPLSLIEFCMAAAAGLGWARLRPGGVPRALWIAGLALPAGVLGWLADPGARGALAILTDPLGALRVHPAGWLLGVSVLRGAVHEHASEEIETSSRALGYAFPVLAASWLLHLGSSGRFIGPALVGSAVCVGAGLLAIAHARLQELGLLASNTRGGRTWPKLATAVVLAVAAVAIPMALASGTSGRDALSAIAGPVGGAVGAWLAPFGAPLAWLASALGQMFNGLSFPSLPGTGDSGNGAATPGSSPPAGPSGTPFLGWLNLAGIAVVAVVLAVRFRRLVAARSALPPAPPPREERRRELHLPRLTLHLPLPSIRLRLALWQRPASAAEAYVALLDDLAERGELGRRPAETPRSHAERGGTLGLPRLPLGLLAADYELTVYGRAAISERETARALGRWRQVRHVARGLPRGGSEP